MATVTDDKQTEERTAERLSKYLTLMLGEEEYGLEILKVREIIGYIGITKVPRMPDFIKGVINLRGKVIPVIDLRRKFGMQAIDVTEETCIIVVDLEETLMGVVVDRVSEVLDIPDEDIEETPDFGTEVSTDFILGVGKSKGKVVMILDIGRVLTSDEIIALSEAGKESQPEGVSDTASDNTAPDGN